MRIHSILKSAVNPLFYAGLLCTQNKKRSAKVPFAEANASEGHFQPFVIKKATQADLPQILEVTEKTYRSVYFEPVSKRPAFSDQEYADLMEHMRASYPAQLNNDKHIILVAKREGVVIGYAKVDLEKNNAFLDKLYVLPEYQGLQIGGHLLLECMSECHAVHHLNSMRLEVWDGNLKGINYYLRNGFIKTDKTHAKTNAAGDVYHGFEMVNPNISHSAHFLKEYLRQKESETLAPRRP